MLKPPFVKSILLTLFCLSLSTDVSSQTLEDYLLSLVDTLENDFQVLNRETLAKAQPDECFYGIGDPQNQFNPNGISCSACEASGGQGKVNQAYVWGMAKGARHLWWGTGPNVHCLVIGGFLGSTGPVQTDSYVCEFNDSKFSPPLPAALGDFRPPKMYKYHLDSHKQKDITPSHPLVQTTLGIRSAGYSQEITFFAGPNLLGGLNFFAFDAISGSFLGAEKISAYSNIRKWKEHNGVLYTAVGNSTGGGSVLRWTGDKTNPFQFEKVGDLDGQGAELEVHEGRLFVTTWPGGIGSPATPGVTASLYMSPPIPSGGLTSTHSASWTKVWNVGDDYEPDSVTASTYGGGALASFDGYLFWGTMHVPFLSTVAHFNAYGIPSTPDSLIAAVLGTYRAISIFKGKDFGNTPDISLVYGSPIFPVYDELTGWDIEPNKKSEFPKLGLPGFGNPFNNYTWTMGVYQGKLYVGTMDFSYLLFGDLDLGSPLTVPFALMDGMGKKEMSMVEEAMLTIEDLFDPRRFVGADLWKFDDAHTRAFPESFAGVGNNSSYGIRSMIADDDDGLILGMANPMNLLACDDITKAINNGLGGWAIICLTASSHFIPTLGEWGIIVLILLLLIFATNAILQRKRLTY